MSNSLDPDQAQHFVGKLFAKVISISEVTTGGVLGFDCSGIEVYHQVNIIVGPDLGPNCLQSVCKGYQHIRSHYWWVLGFDCSGIEVFHQVKYHCPSPILV